jgi:checkpoint serine/threonine-protein kinase
LCIQSNPISPPKEEKAPKQIPEHHVREAVNPRTGRRERVFVDLEAVYPDYRNPVHEMSFEELRAIQRGWMDMDWRRLKEPLQQISGNSVGAECQTINFREARSEEGSPEQSDEKLTIYGQQSHSQERDGRAEHKSGKPKKFKEQGNTQTGEKIELIFISNVS